VIATGKIGDYCNYTPPFSLLGEFDLIGEGVVAPLATHDPRIGTFFNSGEYKKGVKKILLPLLLGVRGYREVYIFTPNSFNLYLANALKLAKVSTLRHYRQKWYELVLMARFRQVPHTKEDLTIESYWKVVTGTPPPQLPEKSLPIIPPPPAVRLPIGERFRVGLSLSAGNRIKTICPETWEKIFKILEQFPAEYYIFGTDQDRPYLQQLKRFNLQNPVHDWLGKIELHHLPYYLSQMDLFISSDTGPSYIADTFQVPLINFAGPCYMKEQRPVGREVLIVESNAPCVPFSFIFEAPYHRKCDGLYKITPLQQREIEEFVGKIFENFQARRREREKSVKILLTSLNPT
jgi:ADP-heptose:LPS heptosyltransferase